MVSAVAAQLPRFTSVRAISRFGLMIYLSLADLFLRLVVCSGLSIKTLRAYGQRLVQIPESETVIGRKIDAFIERSAPLFSA